MMDYTPLEIVNTYISKFGADSDLSHMKLQKLVYLTHAYWLQENNDRVVAADPEVWQYGPVFGHLYHELKDTRNTPIKTPILDPVVAAFGGDASYPSVGEGDKKTHDLIERIWKRYGALTGGDLSNLTHKVGSPWHIMAKKYDFRVPKGLGIPEDIIRSHYRTEIPRLT